MSPCSGTVLAGAAVLSSPALWRAFVAGSAPIEMALTRYLISVAVCWALLALVVTLVGPARDHTSHARDGAPEETDAPSEPAGPTNAQEPVGAA